MFFVSFIILAFFSGGICQTEIPETEAEIEEGLLMEGKTDSMSVKSILNKITVSNLWNPSIQFVDIDVPYRNIAVNLSFDSVRIQGNSSVEATVKGPLFFPIRYKGNGKLNSLMEDAVSAVSISGLSNLNIKNLIVNIPEKMMSMNVSLDSLRIHLESSINGTFKDHYPIKGRGKFLITAEDVVATVTTKLKKKRFRRLEVDSFEISIDRRQEDDEFQNRSKGDATNEILSCMKTFFDKNFSDSIRNKFLKVLSNGPSVPQNQRCKGGRRRRCKAEASDPPSTANVNKCFDLVVRLALQIIGDKKLDPFPIPNWFKNTFINGKVDGLSSLHRHSPAVLHLKDDILTLETVVGLENLTVNYDWKLKFFSSIRGKVKLTIKHISIYLQIGYDSSNRGKKFKVRKLVINNMEGVDFKFTGLHLLGYLTSEFVSKFGENFPRAFGAFLQPHVKNVLESSLNKLLDTLIALQVDSIMKDHFINFFG